MLRERVLVQELQTSVHRGWQRRINVFRVMRERLGRVLGWQRNQRLESPSSPSLVMTAEVLEQLAWHCEEPIVRRPA
jgi:hypothetical protein